MSAGSSTPAALSIVVPTYNERDRLPDLVDALFEAYAAESLDGELIIVDDNSPDGTGRVADELAARPRIGVVHRAGKLGLTRRRSCRGCLRPCANETPTSSSAAATSREAGRATGRCRGSCSRVSPAFSLSG
ncbi:MAG: hypothetical protein DMF86_13625 [Acidobacteria bacterium]|nr:MAG: hypothetical protein DMF86_13625 [Acidobacteriota bacterium]